MARELAFLSEQAYAEFEHAGTWSLGAFPSEPPLPYHGVTRFTANTTPHTLVGRIVFMWKTKKLSAGRELHGEGRAAAGLRARREVALHEPAQAPREREAEPGPAVALASAAVDLGELAEQLAHLLGVVVRAQRQRLGLDSRQRFRGVRAVALR
jgi:hypothetical protein